MWRTQRLTRLKLYALTKQDQKFVWTEECEQALRHLIDPVTNAPIIRFPWFDAESHFILTTDASREAIAAALSQIQDGMEFSIAFSSKGLNEMEQQWPAAEGEMATIVAGIHQFRHYLLGRKFTVCSDNAACVEILKRPKLSPKLHRWSVMVQEYDFIIKHCPG